MKYLIIAVAFFCLALTPAEKAIVQHVQELNQRQRVELDDAKARLVWTYKELEDLQPKIDQVGAERDHWKAYGEQEHEKGMKAETSKLRWMIATGGLSVLVLAFVGLKFFTPLGAFI